MHYPDDQSIYGKRALPITWLVVKGRKGHLSEQVHLNVLNQLHAILPEVTQMVFLDDGEFDGIALQAALQRKGWRYVCRTAKNAKLFEEGHLFSFQDLCLQMDDFINIPQVWCTQEGYGPVTVIATWERGYAHPLYLVTNFVLPHEALYWYKKRFQIEIVFSQMTKTAMFAFWTDRDHLTDLNIFVCDDYPID